jgi:hypothetical protein
VKAFCFECGGPCVRRFDGETWTEEICPHHPGAKRWRSADGKTWFQRMRRVVESAASVGVVSPAPSINIGAGYALAGIPSGEQAAILERRDA